MTFLRRVFVMSAPVLMCSTMVVATNAPASAAPATVWICRPGLADNACDELQGTFALTATGRGFHANVAAGLDEGFRASACVSCGACADTCPTDAITEVSLLP